MTLETMIAERAANVIRVLGRRVIRFCASFRHSKHMQSQKNVFSFLALAAEQRIVSPLLFSFDCGCIGDAMTTQNRCTDSPPTTDRPKAARRTRPCGTDTARLKSLNG